MHKEDKEDDVDDLLYIIVVVPLLISLLALMMMAFGARGGNPCKFLDLFVVCCAACLFIASLFASY